MPCAVLSPLSIDTQRLRNLVKDGEAETVNAIFSFPYSTSYVSKLHANMSKK